MANVVLTGATWGIKDMIKRRGGQFDAASKSWTMDEAKWQQIVEIFKYEAHKISGVKVNGEYQQKASAQQKQQANKAAYYNLVNEGGEGYRG